MVGLIGMSNPPPNFCAMCVAVFTPAEQFAEATHAYRAAPTSRLMNGWNTIPPINVAFENWNRASGPPVMMLIAGDVTRKLSALADNVMVPRIELRYRVFTGTAREVKIAFPPLPVVVEYPAVMLTEYPGNS